MKDDKYVTNNDVAIWKQDEGTIRQAIVWCKNPKTWARVKEWSFSKHYATVFQHGRLIERAFSVPIKKYNQACRSFDFKIQKRILTENQQKSLLTHGFGFKNARTRDNSNLNAPRIEN